MLFKQNLSNIIGQDNKNTGVINHLIAIVLSKVHLPHANAMLNDAKRR